ncbi:testis-expressed protein 15 isoform X2 [Notamacropus eugenii]|uniref:testis-expressed protein 15 isoform X2 n=1 Tax=Notamacropus eugenii TaxID=9315 RepID=UPI003B66F5D6
MEAKETKREKSSSHRGAPCRDPVASGSSSGVEANSLKNFTIPKIQRTPEKVYLSSCHTNWREYSSIRHTLAQCRLDLSCELQSAWQFGETKLVHNEYLERKFSAKRTEMREQSRRGCDLEEHYCFLALSHSAMSRIYQNGLCTRESTMKALGNPLLGVYLFRHTDVALSYARSRKHHVDNLMIFKVLYGKVKKIQPVVDKSKECLDPSPNFDCHMSRLAPTPKDPIEQQACGSAVYLYEYDTLSKPVDKPRQCLPYATVTVRFLGQRAESGPTLTSLRFLSAGFSKWPEKRDSLNNCTVAKRIGKGKDATVIYEHFPKPTDSSAQDSCCCTAEMNPLVTDRSSPCGSGQNGSFFADPVDSQTEHNLEESQNLSQVQTTETNSPVPPSVDATPSGNGDLVVNFNYLEKFLTSLSATVALPNSTGASTVTTSKLIKDPRLLRRAGFHDQANPEAGSGENLLLECPDSEAALPSGSVPSEPMELSPCPEGMFYQHCDYGAIDEVIMEDAEDPDNSDWQAALAHAYQEVIPECKYQGYSNSEMPSTSQTNRTLLPVKKQAKGKYISDVSHFATKGMSTDASPERLSNPKVWKLQPLDFQIVPERLRSPPPEPPPAQQETRNQFIQDTQAVKDLNTDTETYSKQGKKEDSKTKDGYGSAHRERRSDLRNLDLPRERHKTWNLSSQDGSAYKKPRSQGPPSSSPAEKERKVDLKHIPGKAENSRHLASAQKPSKNCVKDWLRCEKMYIDKYFSKSPNGTELKTGRLHLIPIDMKVDASQNMDIIVHTKQKPDDLINLSLNTKVPHFKVPRNGNGKYPVVRGENENEPMSPTGLHKDCRLNACLVEQGDRSQDCPIFCDPAFGKDDTFSPNLNVYFRDQEFGSKDSDGPHPERERRQSPFEQKNRMEDVYVDEKQVVYMNKNCTTIVGDGRERKDLSRSSVMYSEKFSSRFNLAWKKSYVSTETALVKNEDRLTPGNQGGIPPSGERKLMPQASTTTLSEATDPCAAHVRSHSGTSVPIPAAGMPGFSSEYEDNQGKCVGLAQAGQSPRSGTWRRNVLGEDETDMDYGRPSVDCEQPAGSEDQKLLFPQELHFDNEIEVECEQYKEPFLRQTTATCGNLSADEMNSVYQLLESRIDWENLFGSNWRQLVGSQSSLPQKDRSQCLRKESSCIFSYTQKNHRKLLNPMMVPDLQIQITNIIHSEFALAQEPLKMQDEGLMCASPEITEVEMIDAWEELEPVASPSQFTCENKNPPGKEELGLKVCPEASELAENLDVSPPPDSSVHKAAENPLTLSPQPADTSQTTKDQSTYPLAKSRDAHNRTSKVKDVEPKSSKGKKRPAPLKDKTAPRRNFRNPEASGVIRKTTHHQSSEQFSSLSEGRIKTFSQSERHIRNVLDALYSEVSLCKSKRLSRKLGRAVLHLKKAHRGVHRSLQLITKVGEKKRNSPLPRSYEVIRNSLWECCDLEGYNFLTERRYYSRHCWQRRKDDRREERRTSELEVVQSRASASRYQDCGSSSRDQGVRRSLSIEEPFSKVSVNHVSIPRSTSPDRPHHSASRGSSLSKGSVKDPRKKAGHKVPQEESKGVPSYHADRERSLDFIFLSSIHTEERSERPLGDLPFTEASSAVVSAPSRMERSDIGEKSLPLDPYQPNLEGDGETHSRGNSDLFISVLKSSTERFFNVDISKRDHLKLPRDPLKLEGHLPAKKSLAPAVSPKPSSASEHVVGGSGCTAPWTSQEGESVLQNFPCISVKNDEAEWWTPHSKKLSKGLSSVGSLATHTPCQRQEQSQLQNDGKDALDTMWGSCKNCPPRRDRKEGSRSQSALVGSTPVEKKKNAAEGLLLNPRSSSSQKSEVKRKDKRRRTKRVQREQRSEKRVQASSLLLGSSEKSPVQIQKQGRQDQAVDGTSVVAASPSKETPRQLATTEEKEGRMEVDNKQTLCPSAPPTEAVGDSARRKTCAVQMAGPARQPPPTSESEEGQSSEDPTTLIVKLSRILQKADEASTLKSLQEQIQMCQTVLPLFIEAFERKQKCSFKHVLISRNLLAEGNRWSNCRHCLSPRAVDSLVELQMMMETMQFIENKKGLLSNEPTFRSLLWYDASLYGELLQGNQGYQQQSCLYPAFQDRLKYNAFSELQHYHGQLVKLLEEARKEEKSYYVILKYKRQIEECEDILRHCSNHFAFTLSAPFTCGVNFGDNLEDLEMLRKSTLELISNPDHVPKIPSCPGKQDHLWIIMEMISSKMHFIKNSESVSVKVSLYGLEHIFFDAAKSLVWKERGLSSGKNGSPEKGKKDLLVFNQCAFKKLQQIYETLEAHGKAEHASQGWPEDACGNAPSEHRGCLKGEGLGRGGFPFSGTLFCLPDICCLGEVLEQAKSADLKQLEELMVRCRDHFEALKKCFQILQEAAVDSVLITEDNVLDVVKKPSHQVVILKPEAVEMYIEVVMLAETIHFLKNVMAKKLDKPRFRGMLWFEFSLLPELIENQEKTASFSFLKENAAACLWKVVEAAILELKGDSAVICEYSEGTNSSYALQMLSRELAELSEIKMLLAQATLPIATYVDLVPYTASMNDLNVMDVRNTGEPGEPLWDERKKTADGGGLPDLGLSPCLSQTRKGSPDVPEQGSLGLNGPLLLQAPPEDSPPPAQGPAGPQGSPVGMRGRGLFGSLRSFSEGTLPGTPAPSPQMASLLRPGADAFQATPFSACASFCSEVSHHSTAAVEDLNLVGADDVQHLNLIPLGHAALVLQPACLGPAIPHQSGPRAEPPTPESQSMCPFSQQQQQPKDLSGVFVPASGGCWNCQPPGTPQRPHAYKTPYSSWCTYHYGGSSGSSATQTHHGITSYQDQPLPAAVAVAPVCHVPANLLCCLGPRSPPRSRLRQLLLPEQGLNFCTSHGCLLCPTAPCAASQVLPHDPRPPRPGLCSGVTCTCAPRQQGSFQNGH